MFKELLNMVTYKEDDVEHNSTVGLFRVLFLLAIAIIGGLLFVLTKALGWFMIPIILFFYFLWTFGKPRKQNGDKL